MGAYSRTVILSGSSPVRWTIGGDAFEGGERVGYQRPTRLGVVALEYLQRDDWPAAQVTADLVGYDARQVEGVDLPAEVLIELPCTVVLTPLSPIVGEVTVCLIAAPVSSPWRGWGQRQSRSLDGGAVVPIPLWARAAQGPLVVGGVDLELADASGTFGGAAIPGGGLPSPLPAWARWVRASAPTSDGWVTFLGGL